MTFCLSFCLCCHNAQMASFVFHAVILSYFPCVSAFLPSFSPFKVFLQERSESSPILYLGKLRSREVKLLITRARKLGPPPGFWPLWQSIFINAFLLNTFDSMHQKAISTNITLQTTLQGKKRVVRSCSSRAVLQSWKVVPSCKQLILSRKLHKQITSLTGQAVPQTFWRLVSVYRLLSSSNHLPFPAKCFFQNCLVNNFMLFAQLIFSGSYSHYHPNYCYSDRAPQCHTSLINVKSRLFTNLSHLTISSPWGSHSYRDLAIKRGRATHDLKKQVKMHNYPPKVSFWF